MKYDYAMENKDYSRIDKLNALNDPKAFWDDVRKLTKAVKSDRALNRWFILAEKRYSEISQ